MVEMGLVVSKLVHQGSFTFSCAQDWDKCLSQTFLWYSEPFCLWSQCLASDWVGVGGTLPLCVTPPGSPKLLRLFSCPKFSTKASVSGLSSLTRDWTRYPPAVEAWCTNPWTPGISHRGCVLLSQGFLAGLACLMSMGTWGSVVSPHEEPCQHFYWDCPKFIN